MFELIGSRDASCGLQATGERKVHWIIFVYDGMVMALMDIWLEMQGVREYYLLAQVWTSKVIDSSRGQPQGNVFTISFD